MAAAPALRSEGTGLAGRLLAGARDPGQPEILALAHGVALTWGWPLGPAGGVLGLDREASRALLAAVFPGVGELLDELPAQPAEADGDRGDEFADLLGLLLAHRLRPNRDGEWLARAVAAGCLGDNHLWEDLGLPSRAQLSALLDAWFPALVARNAYNLRWKRFFYRQLCETTEIRLCKAPSCGVCSDYAACFGGGTAPAAIGSAAP
mgnify:CR=1 FL=1